MALFKVVKFQAGYSNSEQTLATFSSENQAWNYANTCADQQDPGRWGEIGRDENFYSFKVVKIEN